MSEYYAKFRRGDMNLDDKLDESEFLYFQHPEHNPQSTKDLVEDMIENFDRNQDKVNCQQHDMAWFRIDLIPLSLRVLGLCENQVYDNNDKYQF